MKRHTQLGVEENFFAAPRPASLVKLQIISEYFEAYMNKLARDRVVGYADLFAGPGSYDDGTESTPVVICKKVAGSERLRRFVRLWFNEADPALHSKLRDNIAAVPGIAGLQFEPAVTRIKISTAMATKLEHGIPALMFADPCGYKGLSLRLITSALRRPKTDCVFFFNYNRVNMKLDYSIMDESIDEFFEPARAAILRAEVKALNPAAREVRVLDAIADAISKVPAYTIPFRFRTRYRGGTSHHLIYASKNVAALAMMKRIMTKASSDIIQGVGSLDFSPSEDFTREPLFAGLYEVQRRLLETFRSRTLTLSRIIREEASETKYTDTNYRDALLDLENEGSVIMDPPAQARRFQAGGAKRTLAGTTCIKFPD